MFARELHAGRFLGIDGAQLEVLCDAIERHSYGTVSDNPTVGTCWDADRIELRRMGTTVQPRLLSTDAGRARLAGL